jgi:hypothetical protein
MLAKQTSDWVCDGCGSEVTTESIGTHERHALIAPFPLGWRADRNTSAGHETYLCAGCADALDTSRRHVLAARKKFQKGTD